MTKGIEIKGVLVSSDMAGTGLAIQMPGSGLPPVISAFEAIGEYKKEIFDLYDRELLTLIVNSNCDRFSSLTGAISEKVMKVRSMFLLGEGDSKTDWLDIGTRFLLLQNRAEEIGCRVVYGRAGFLVLRVSQLMQKMKRQEAKVG